MADANTGGSRGPRSPLPEELQPWFPGLEIVELLGTGGMGAVYKARQPRLNRLVALKILTCPSEQYADFAIRFEREAQVMARLNHPHIVTIFDFGEVDRSAAGLETMFFFLMEFVEGSDLNQLIRSAGMDSAEALAFVPQICEALQFAHDEGITHRDIKPANILVDRKGHVKIADFGLAKLIQGDETLAMGLTMTGTAMGTPQYMAPEQWEAPEKVDHRADIYALGVVIYELLTGERPAGVFDPPSKKCKVDRRMDTVVMRAMERDPAKRFSQVREVGEAITRVAAIPQGGLRRRRPLVWAAAAAGLALLAGLGVPTLREGIPETNLGAGEGGGALVPATVSEPTKATKDAPFENSLGMKFVPVPGTDVLFCIHETRWRDYAAYAEDAGAVDPNWLNRTHDGFTVKEHPEDHPVVQVSWDDAQAFCAALSEKEGRTYRLPTDREWSIAVGIGREERWEQDTTPETVDKPEDVFPWGREWPPPPDAGNYSDQSRSAKAPRGDPQYLDAYDDGYPTTAPVMRFAPNQLGIYDLGGNVWEWCDDWWNGSNEFRVLRGGSWRNHERVNLLSSVRGRVAPTRRDDYGHGFRVVLEVAAKSTPSSAANLHNSPPSASHPSTPEPALVRATKDAPLENSLGMKFVPVPGTDVLFCIHETRWRDYAAYAEDNDGVNNDWRGQNHGGFKVREEPGDHPVAGVSWEDAKAFCAWLSQKEGKTYRLPTDREWSIAVGIGDEEVWKPDTTPATVFRPMDKFPWGKEWPPPPGSGNYNDESRREMAPREDGQYLDGYDDGYPTTAPVMRFKPNEFGIFDLGGNVWEWCEDWYSEAQTERVLRGGCFYDHGRSGMLSAYRYSGAPDLRGSTRGFRMVLEIADQSQPPAVASHPAASLPASPPVANRMEVTDNPLRATKDAPFENSLAMKFVPVPGTDVLFCIHETRWRDYAVYAEENPGLDSWWRRQAHEGFEIEDSPEEHPVVHASWEDASAFCAWLSEKEGRTYRLPTDREWSVAVGIGREERWRSDTPPHTVDQLQGIFPWGKEWPPLPGAGNYSDESRKAKAPRDDAQYLDGYDDGYPTTAPVMRFAPNQHGLFDMGGNVWEWMEDNYSNDQNNRVLRGGSWSSDMHGPLLSSFRALGTPTVRHSAYGFRVVLDFAAFAPTVSVSPALFVEPEPNPAATKDAPFENSLAMKFVPVPGTDVLFCIHETRWRDYADYAEDADDIAPHWRNQIHDGFVVDDNPADHPVVKVSWEDAQAFCLWLSEKEGKTYRLPTDREWSIAVGIGREEQWRSDTNPTTVFKPQDVFPWGKDWPPPEGAGNYSDESRWAKAPGNNEKYIDGYDDGFPTTAPVMSFEPNELGLFDLGGNVWEWVNDWNSDERNENVLRGASWYSYAPGPLLSSTRALEAPGSLGAFYGFRVVLEIAAESPPPAAAIPPAANLPASPPAPIEARD